LVSVRAAFCEKRLKERRDWLKNDGPKTLFEKKGKGDHGIDRSTLGAANESGILTRPSRRYGIPRKELLEWVEISRSLEKKNG